MRPRGSSESPMLEDFSMYASHNARSHEPNESLRPIQVVPVFYSSVSRSAAVRR